MKRFNTFDKVSESNHIEAITREPLRAELDAFDAFLRLNLVTLGDMCAYVRAIEPTIELRAHEGMNVRIGKHLPPSGGPVVVTILENLLSLVNARTITPYRAHMRYETLHPFMDGNGRSGRMLWYWMMRGSPNEGLGFLHAWYYQTLDADR